MTPHRAADLSGIPVKACPDVRDHTYPSGLLGGTEIFD